MAQTRRNRPSTDHSHSMTAALANFIDGRVNMPGKRRIGASFRQLRKGLIAADRRVVSVVIRPKQWVMSGDDNAALVIAKGFEPRKGPR